MSYIKFWKIHGENKRNWAETWKTFKPNCSNRSAGSDLKVIQPPLKPWFTLLSAGQIIINESDQQQEQVPLEECRKSQHDRGEKIKMSITVSHAFTPLTLCQPAEHETPMMLCSAVARMVTRGFSGALVIAALIALVTAEAGEPCEVHQDGVNHFVLKKRKQTKTNMAAEGFVRDDTAVTRTSFHHAGRACMLGGVLVAVPRLIFWMTGTVC